MRNQLDDLRTRREFTEHARNHGADVDDSGFWIFVRTRRGVTVFSRGDGELPTNLRRHLIEIFLSLGLALFLVIVVVAWL